MRYGSVCSGIEAASVAWEPLGWRPAWFSEVDKFPSAVLKHHYPSVKNHGDFTSITAANADPIDLLVGGTPCQDFSVAGLRKGLDGERGNLTLQFVRLAGRLKPRWIVWENVPGVLSIDNGRAFGAFLGGLAECGYGFAYRVLDAQYFGVPQRRRRVFVVANLGGWRRAAAVLFERAGVCGDTQKGQKEGQAVAAHTSTGVGTCGADDNQAQAGHLIASTGNVSHCLNAGGMKRIDYETETLITPSCLSRVRRLIPRETERLQGFPDDYTLVLYRGKPAADGPRYKALGNSMAVPVMRWIGERIQMMESIKQLSATIGPKNPLLPFERS